MELREILESDSWKTAARFHGHVCPGLAIGYRAAMTAMDWLKDQRSLDEEIVAISETNACGVDAIQTITGCTSGKGNLILKDYGKNVFTFVSRNTGQGIRISLKPDILSLDPRHRELINLVRLDQANEDEIAEFRKIHTEKSHSILAKEIDELFALTQAKLEMPAKAVIEPSELCQKCMEPTMPSKTELVGELKVCRDCYSKM
ncbi:MAG: FmdE family protein [Syntrophaceae bacterium]|nr:FmdE family protein [Syntrophaceae bacterium]